MRVRRYAEIVTGNRLYPDGTMRDVLKHRLDVAIARHDPGNIVIVSGGHLPHTTRTEAGLMREYLASHGIPYEDIFLEDQSLKTFENALFTVEILRARDLTPKEVITSAYHAPKVAYCFRRAYGEPIPVHRVAPRNLKERLLFVRVPFDLPLAAWQMRGQHA